MCLIKDKYSTKSLKKRLSKRGYIIAYKIIEKGYNELHSIVNGWNEWNCGWNKSSRLDSSFLDIIKRYIRECKTKTIYKGFHVYLNRPSIILGGRLHRIIKVICLKKDFIASNENEAVFAKVYLPKYQYNKAMK